MTVIEQLVEALKYHTAQTRPIQQTIEAIAAGEAELRREPVAIYGAARLTPPMTREFYGWLADGVTDLPKFTKLYTREEIK